MNTVIEDERNAHAEIDKYEDYLVELFLDTAKGVGGWLNHGQRTWTDGLTHSKRSKWRRSIKCLKLRRG